MVQELNKSPKKVRKYTDLFGQKREIEYMGFGGVGRWHKACKESIFTRWKLEDGSVVGIPNDAWKFQGIEYTEEEVK